MKIALYIEDGREQIVLTPQTKTERDILGKLCDGDRRLDIYRGEFYACQGGWVRHREPIYEWSAYGPHRDNDNSTILVLTPKEGQRE